jgi:hypothetical protein
MPMVVKIQPRGIDIAVPLLSTQTVASQGFAQLLRAHTQLFGKPYEFLSQTILPDRLA